MAEPSAAANQQRGQPAQRLARWRALLRVSAGLGPWARPKEDAGSGSASREIPLFSPASSSGRAHVHVPSRLPAAGSFIFVHGLNPWGAADPRIVQLARALARAGFLVVVPCLSDFMQLRLSGRVVEELKAAVQLCTRLPEHPSGARPALFASSFGALPALQLAAAPATRDTISGAVLHGAFAELRGVIRHALGLDRRGPSPEGYPEPLILPALAINLCSDAGEHRADGQLHAIIPAWQRFVEATWGSEQMKQPARHRPLAHELASRLEPRAREIFLQGCGLSDNSVQFFRPALERDGMPWALDLRPLLADLRCPLRLIHATADRVVPQAQMEALRAAAPPGADVRCHLTGLYQHARPRSSAELLRLGPALLGEGATLLRALSSIVEIGFRG